jgi:cell division protein ZapB
VHAPAIRWRRFADAGRAISHDVHRRNTHVLHQLPILSLGVLIGVIRNSLGDIRKVTQGLGTVRGNRLVGSLGAHTRLRIASKEAATPGSQRLDALTQLKGIIRQHGFKAEVPQRELRCGLAIERFNVLGCRAAKGQIERFFQFGQRVSGGAGEASRKGSTQGAMNFRGRCHDTRLEKRVGAFIKTGRVCGVTIEIETRHRVSNAGGGVDPPRACPYSADNLWRHASSVLTIDDDNLKIMSDDNLKVLEDKIDQLIGLCAQLNRENHALKTENLGYQQERRDLIAKNEMARARVEATLQRLRSMEATS